MKTKISVCIITKNEEKNITRCLKSLEWADEIIIVDSGSVDDTIEICKKFDCKIYQSEWLGFGTTKKLAVDYAVNDWILSIDADEEISDQLRNKLHSILNTDDSNGYKIKRNSIYLNKEIKFSGWQDDFPLRLFNKREGNFNDASVHESVVLANPKIKKINEPIFHYPYYSISIHIKKINLYSQLSAEKMYQIGRKTNLLFALTSAMLKFFKMYFIRFGFMDGKVGFILSTLSAYSNFLKYLKLWELWKIKK